MKKKPSDQIDEQILAQKIEKARETCFFFYGDAPENQYFALQKIKTKMQNTNTHTPKEFADINQELKRVFACMQLDRLNVSNKKKSRP